MKCAISECYLHAFELAQQSLHWSYKKISFCRIYTIPEFITCIMCCLHASKLAKPSLHWPHRKISFTLTGCGLPLTTGGSTRCVDGLISSFICWQEEKGSWHCISCRSYFASYKIRGWSHFNLKLLGRNVQSTIPEFAFMGWGEQWKPLVGWSMSQLQFKLGIFSIKARCLMGGWRQQGCLKLSLWLCIRFAWSW